ncbi:hypothetical protein Trydic_g19116 [Trypoxylus dichotomus]
MRKNPMRMVCGYVQHFPRYSWRSSTSVFLRNSVIGVPGVEHEDSDDGVPASVVFPKKIKQERKVYMVDHSSSECGDEVLYLLPYYWEFNAIEITLAQKNTRTEDDGCGNNVLEMRKESLTTFNEEV